MRTLLPPTLIGLLFVSAPALAETWNHEGVEVHYSVAGSGAPVVQLHGIGAGASSAQTAYQVDTLVAAGYQVYSLDFPGWGESIGPELLYTGAYYAETVADFLREVVPAPAALVGHSLGGTYAIAAAAEAPDRVTALVLNAPAGVLSFTEAPDAASAASWARIVSTPAGQGFYSALGSWPSLKGFCVATLYVDASYCDADTVQDYWQYTQQPESIYGAASFLSGNLGLDVSADFAALTVPVQLIWGAENPFTSLDEANAFLALNPLATLVVIDGAGAMVNDEAQDAFDTSMLEQLAAVP